jgi:Tripartite tricarboxylate transporter family receptor
MKIPRRRFLHLAAGAAAVPLASPMARAQSYPTRPIRWIVAAAAGNTSDITARLMGQWLSERLGQPVIVENRPGAGGNIGTEAAVRAPADGYTLLLVSSPQVINATLYEHLTFNLIRDIAPVAGISRAADVMEGNATVGYGVNDACIGLRSGGRSFGGGSSVSWRRDNVNGLRVATISSGALCAAEITIVGITQLIPYFLSCSAMLAWIAFAAAMSASAPERSAFFSLATPRP